MSACAEATAQGVMHYLAISVCLESSKRQFTLLWARMDGIKSAAEWPNALGKTISRAVCFSCWRRRKIFGYKTVFSFA